MSIEPTNRPSVESSQEQSAERRSPAVLDAEKIFAGNRELRLLYRNEEYRLLITRNNKLILIK